MERVGAEGRGSSLGSASATGVLKRSERLRYELELARVYAGHGTKKAAAGSSVAEPVMTTEELEAKLDRELKMTDALMKRWGESISEADLQTEYERMLRHTNDPAQLKRLFHALDDDSNVIARCLIQPILVRRQLYKKYWWDPEIHSATRRTAEEELGSQDGSGGLLMFSGERTVTEYRLDHGEHAPRIEFENGAQVRYLDQAAWDAMLAGLDRRWGISGTKAADSQALPVLQFSPLEEQKEYFWASTILERDSTHLKMANSTWWKETFSDWWSDHSSDFSVDAPTIQHRIELRRPEASAQPISLKADRAVSSAWYTLAAGDSNTPSARDQHTAVWTGTQMIVWGGTNGTQNFKSGGVYDPGTDSWSPTSEGTNCPTARVGHSAAWLSTRMAIWGGWDGSSNYYATGSKYNPSTDAWNAITTTGAPLARRDHVGVAFDGGNTLYVWGGRTTTTLGTQSGGQLVGATWYDWTPETNTPSGRNHALAVVDSNYGDIFVWGGNEGTGWVNDGGVYQNNDGWYDVPSTGAPSARFGETGVVSGHQCTFDDRAIIWGGYDSFASPHQLDSGGVYSLAGAGGAWDGATPIDANTPSGRYNHTAVMDTTSESDIDIDRMIVWGGETSAGVTNTGGILNLCNDSWVATDTSDSDLPSARSQHTAVWTGEAMLVWGGSGSTYYADGAAFTYCWGAPTTTQRPAVDDESECDASGLRVRWGDVIDWNDHDFHRRVEIVRDGSVIASDLDFSDYSYLDTTAGANQSHDYQVRFVNSCGLSVDTASRSGVDVASSNPVVTVVPTADDADGCAIGSGIDITWPQDPDDWGDNGHGTRQYRVWRWDALNGWVAQGSKLDYGTTTYHDATATPSMSYGYRVKYINGCTDTTDSPQTPLVSDSAGNAPGGIDPITAQDADSCDYSGNLITWSQDPYDWGDDDDGTRQYRVRRSTDGGATWSAVGSLLPYGTTSYVDGGANSDQETLYQVRYKNGCGYSTDSASAASTDIVTPAAPTVTVNSSSDDPDYCVDGGVVISWQQDADTWCDNGTGPRTYDVLRDGSPIQTGIAYGTTSYTDTSGVNGTRYNYAVRYNNTNGLSTTTSGTPGNDRPIAPTTLANNTATDPDLCDSAGVLVSWATDPDGNWGDGHDGTRTYDVLREGTPIQTGIAYGTTSFTDTTGAGATSYSYQVRYTNGCGLSSTTTGDSAADFPVAPATPANNTAADISSCQADGVTISWAADPAGAGWGDGGSGTRSYRVLRDGSQFQPNIVYGTTSTVDTGGTANQAYTYTVGYINGCGMMTFTDPGAQATDFEGVPDGDTNDDGSVDTADLLDWLSHLYDAGPLGNADVNCDNAEDARDVATLDGMLGID